MGGLLKVCSFFYCGVTFFVLFEFITIILATLAAQFKSTLCACSIYNNKSRIYNYVIADAKCQHTFAARRCSEPRCVGSANYPPLSLYVFCINA